MRNRGTVIGDLVAVRNTDDEPDFASPDWTYTIVFDGSLLPPAGDDGKDGRDGVDGKDGRDGFNGRDGKDGADGKNGEPGMQWAGMYSRRVAYRPGQVVGFEGSSYVCVLESVGHEPTSTRYFQPVALMGERGERGEQGGAGARGRSVRQYEIEDRLTELEEGTADLPSAIAEVEITRGQVVYIRKDNGNLDLVRANAYATSIPLGIAVDTVTAGQSCRFITGGAVTIPEWNLEPGKVYFASDDVAGELTLIEPEDAGDYVLIILTAVSTTTAIVEIHRAYAIGPLP